MDNKKWLGETLAEKYENQKKLYVGQTVRIIENSKNTMNRIRVGEIIGLYPKYMLVQFKNCRETFNYIDFITSITNYGDANRNGEKLFNAKFNKGYKRISVEMIPFPLKLASNLIKPREVISKCKVKEKEIKYRHWSEEKIEYLMSNKDSMSRTELTNKFNKKFRTDVTRQQINAAIHREVHREEEIKL